MKAHFRSGLPRSGSTLLAALLRQNTRFHAAMTSPVGGLVQILEAMSEENECSVFIVIDLMLQQNEITILQPDLFEQLDALLF
ncbi:MULTISPECIES: hypothetical protein [unclassified Microcoleus]|uniref:hypothetical protein n=1 Tax=unclassified Microcoleus TaxID=2642155 RepID=UPI002FD06855